MELVKNFITTFVGERLINVIKSGTDIMADEICHVANNKILEYLSVEYERNKKTKTILHRTEPIELEKFYQPLFLNKASRQWDFEKNRSKNRNRNNHIRINTEKISSLFEENNCITIIGTAGSGKSTLVKYLFVDTIKRNYKIPLKVELRYLNNYSGNLISYIKNEIIKFSEIAKSERIIDNLLNSGNFVVFLDGYDEISSIKKEEITKDICNFTKKYSGNKYIVTSRPLVNVDMLENFHNYCVSDMTFDEIISFVRKQFSETEQELADKIVETISIEEKKTYRSFLGNPLLLSMFIITYQSDSNIPQRRSDYYNQVFNTLYSVHDTSSKLGFVREKKTGLLKENFIDLLKRFSFKSFFSQNYTFSEEYFNREMQNIKKDLTLHFSNDDLLYDLEVAIGILTQEGLDITYPHRSLQEYFAALFVTTLTYENKLKVYNRLYEQFLELLSNKFLKNDYVNFYSLLGELDKVNFDKNLVIPILKSIKQHVGELNGTIAIIDYFVSIRNTTFLFDDEMKSCFDKEHFQYNQIFRQYLENYDKFKNVGVKDDIDKYDKARDMLANNNILPFLKSYNFDKIIYKINTEINRAESIDSAFIDNLL